MSLGLSHGAVTASCRLPPSSLTVASSRQTPSTAACSTSRSTRSCAYRFAARDDFFQPSRSVLSSGSARRCRESGTRGSRLVVRAAADYYTTLGVAKSASKQDIKSAYRRLARQFHPDVNKDPGAEDKFKEISTAYEVLSDEEKRPLYDRFGEAGVSGNAGMGGAGAYASNPFDLFESIFGAGMGAAARGGMGGMGGTPRARQPVPGDDVKMEIPLEFREVILGAEKTIDVTHLDECGVCQGSGAKQGTAPKTCPTCRGMGQVMQTRQTAFGMFSSVSTCNTCQGVGEVISEFCRKCGGEGRLRVRKPVVINVPPGVDSGTVLRVKGEGDAGTRGGKRGDLYVFVKVKETPGIRRDGINLFSTVNIEYTDAILGTVAKVATVDGPSDLRVPPGTQPGDTLVLERRGVPKVGKPAIRGDHLFTMNVTIPRRVTATERDMVEELAAIGKTGRTRAGEVVEGARPRGSSSSNLSADGDGIVDSVKSAVSGVFNWLKDKK